MITTSSSSLAKSDSVNGPFRPVTQIRQSFGLTLELIDDARAHRRTVNRRRKVQDHLSRDSIQTDQREGEKMQWIDAFDGERRSGGIFCVNCAGQVRLLLLLRMFDSVSMLHSIGREDRRNLLFLWLRHVRFNLNPVENHSK